MPFKGNQLCLENFIAAFPQKYNRQLLHFRFKREDAQHGYVWADLKNPMDVLPAFKGIVIAKVLTLCELNVNKRKTRLRRKANADHGKDGAQANAKLVQSLNRDTNNRNKRDMDMEAHDHEDDEYEEEAETHSPVSRAPAPSSTSAQPPVPAAPNAVKPPASSSGKVNPAVPTSGRPVSTSLLDGDDVADNKTANGKPSLAADVLNTDVDMINFGDSPRGNSNKAGSASGKKMNTSGGGGGSSSSSSSSGTVDIDEKPASFGTNGLSRDELKDRREAEIAAKVAAAKEFKDDCDEKARQSAEEIETAKAKHDKNLDAWAANNKEKRNVRTLLTTMHTVLWPDSGWKPIGLGDVIEASKVNISCIVCNCGYRILTGQVTVSEGHACCSS